MKGIASTRVFIAAMPSVPRNFSVAPNASLRISPVTRNTTASTALKTTKCSVGVIAFILGTKSSARQARAVTVEKNAIIAENIHSLRGFFASMSTSLAAYPPLKTRF